MCLCVQVSGDTDDRRQQDRLFPGGLVPRIQDAFMDGEKGFLLVLSQFSLTQQCEALPHQTVKVLHEKVLLKPDTLSLIFQPPKFPELKGGQLSHGAEKVVK